MIRVLLMVGLLAACVSPAAAAMDPHRIRQAERYEAILSDQPDQARALDRLVKIYTDAGALQELLARFEKECHSRPTAAITLGQIQLRIGNASAARATFESASAQLPDDTRPLAGLAEALAKSGDFAAAAETLEHAAAIDPKDSAAAGFLLSAAMAWRDAGNPERAKSALTKCAELNQISPDIRKSIAAEAMRSGDIALARTQFLWLADHDTPSGRVAALTELSHIHASKNEVAAAIGDLDRALELLGPDHWQRPAIDRQRIYLHIRNGSLSEFAGSVRTDAEMNPTDASRWLLLAEIQWTMGEHDQRLASLRRAFAASPDRASLGRQLALAEADAGNVAEARKMADAALATTPGDPDWAFLLAELDVRQNATGDAAARLESLAASHPNDAALHQRVLTFFEKNRMLSALQRFSESTPSIAASPNLLATFGRTPEVLNSLAAAAMKQSATDPENAAATLLTVAKAFGDQGTLNRALELAKQAAERDPASPEIASFLVSTLTESGQSRAASDYADAFVSAHPASAEAVDYSLFQAFAQSLPKGIDVESASDLVAGMMASIEPGETRTPAVQERHAALKSRADDSRAIRDILRLAHWELWMNTPESAAATVRLALAEHLDNADLLDFQARLAASSGDTGTALRALQQLAAIDPSRRSAASQRSAELLLERGDTAEATAVFAALAEAKPEDPTGWMNLASVQQRTGNWYLALDTWMRAYGLSTPSGRRQLAKPILAVMERLTLYDRAVDFLVSNALGEPEEDVANGLFANAAAFASKHGRIRELAALLDRTWESGNRTTPLLLARASLATMRGKPSESLPLMVRAAGQSRDPSAAWGRVLDAALEAGDSDQALFAAAQAARDSEDPAAWIRLARTQQSVRSTEDAAATWRRIGNAFSRDAVALEAAADFFESQGLVHDAAIARFNAASLDGASPSTLARAARIARKSGDRAMAVAHFKKILATTAPLATSAQPWPGPWELPDVSVRHGNNIAMRALGGMFDPEVQAVLRETARMDEAESDAILRLEAIRALAELSSDGSARRDWITWCKDPERPPREAIWGLHAAGESGDALDLLDACREELPRPDAEQATIAIALDGRQFARLRNWIDASLPDRRRRSEFLFLALSSRFAGAPPAHQDLVAILDPASDTVTETWQAAWMLAIHGHFSAAAKLASHVLPLTPPKVAAGGIQSLASWLLTLGDHPGALAALAVPSQRSAFTLDQPFFEAIRTRWLLESAEGRSDLATAIRNDPDPIVASGGSALLAALAGDSNAIATSVRDLSDAWSMRTPPPDADESLETIFQSSINASQAWRLPDLALALADAAMAHPMLTGNAAWMRDMVLLRSTAAIQSAPPRMTAYHLNEIPLPAVGSTELAGIARHLDVLGYTPAAVRVREAMLELKDIESGPLMEMAIAARRRGDASGEIAALKQLIPANAASPSFAGSIDSALRLAALLAEGKQPAAALAVLKSASEFAPADPRIATAMDAALFDLGRLRERVDLWKSLATHQPDYSAGWLNALVDLGRPDEALRLAAEWTAEGRGLRPDALIVLARARAVAVPTEKNLSLDQLFRQSSWTSLATAAVALKESAHAEQAKTLLRMAIGKPATQSDRLALARAWIAIAPIDTPTAQIISRAIEPDRDSSDVGSALAAMDLEVSMAGQNPDLKRWLTDRLKNQMSHGPENALAAWSWIRLQLLSAPDPEPIDSAVSNLDLTSIPEALALTLAADLARENFHRAAARIYQHLYAANPNRREFAFDAALQMWRAGERDEPMRVVERWLPVRELDPSLHALVARFYCEIGDTSRSIELFSELVAKDPGVTDPAAWAALGVLHAKRGDKFLAMTMLTAAYSNPDFRDVSPIIESLPPASSPSDVPSGLPETIRVALHLEMAERLMDSAAPSRAAEWIVPGFAQSDAGLALLSRMASAPGAAQLLDAFWSGQRTELPDSRSVRSAHAEFLLARASRSSSGEDRASDLRRAADEAPWRWDAVRLWAVHLADAGAFLEADSAISRHLESGASLPDRAAATAFLGRTKSSDGLPTEPRRP